MDAGSTLVRTSVAEVLHLLAKELDVPFVAATVLDEEHEYCLQTDVDDVTLAECERNATECQSMAVTGNTLSIHNVPPRSLRRHRRSKRGALQAYMGMPLKSDRGVVLGSICVLDTRPRVWSAADHYAVHEATLELRDMLEKRAS